MPLNISDVFSQLRHDKEISQCKAAQDLGISQALLSHYENGIREPRLEFIVRACDYYGVSADYIFGRAAARENPLAICDPKDGRVSPWEDEKMRGLISSLSGLLTLLYDVYGPKTAGCASRYLASAIYMVTRAAGCVPANPDVPGQPPAPLCDAQLKLTEAALVSEICSSGYCKDAVNNIREEYPQLCKLICSTEQEIAELALKGDAK